MFRATVYNQPTNKEKHRKMANKWNINSAKVMEMKIKGKDDENET